MNIIVLFKETCDDVLGVPTLVCHWCS